MYKQKSPVVYINRPDRRISHKRLKQSDTSVTPCCNRFSKIALSVATISTIPHYRVCGHCAEIWPYGEEVRTVMDLRYRRYHIIFSDVDSPLCGYELESNNPKLPRLRSICTADICPDCIHELIKLRGE